MTFLRMLICVLCFLAPSVVWSASLKVTPSEIELGSLKEGPPVVKRVVIANTGAEEVNIANVKAS